MLLDISTGRSGRRVEESTLANMEYYSSLDASQLDSETPTLFELISASQLESLLSPSLRYILVHYTQRYPNYLLKITNRFDELNLVFRSFIEWYFLKYWQGSFTENFYGLKRVRQTPLSDKKYNSSKLTQLVPSMVEARRSLSGLQTIISIFEITGVSYLSEKFNYWHEVWYSKYITGQLDLPEYTDKKQYFQTLFKRKFVEIFPTVQSILRAGNLITTLLYLSGGSKSPTLLTALFKMNYSRLNQYDYQKNEPSSLKGDKEKPNRISPPTTIEYILRLITNNFTRPSWKAIRLVLGTFFPVAIFTLKFLEWWNNSDFSLKIAKNEGDVLQSLIPPPSTLNRNSSLEKKLKKLYKSGDKCPLCKEEINNPAIIETGYVFCYKCIYNYLTESHKIVGKRAKESAKHNTHSDSDSDSDSEDDEAEDHPENVPTQPNYDVSKGGRCPITGKKLLGCKWNPLTEEFEVEGLRRLIF